MGFTSPVCQLRKLRHETWWEGSGTYLNEPHGSAFPGSSSWGSACLAARVPLILLLQGRPAVSLLGLRQGGKVWPSQEARGPQSAHRPEPHLRV